MHPSIESMVWAYHLGKPKEQVDMTGKFTMNQCLEAEGQLIRSTLDPSELELLAEQSQRLLDDALARARAKQLPSATIDAVTAPSTAPAISVDGEPLDGRGEPQTTKPGP